MIEAGNILLKNAADDIPEIHFVPLKNNFDAMKALSDDQESKLITTM